MRNFEDFMKAQAAYQEQMDKSPNRYCHDEDTVFEGMPKPSESLPLAGIILLKVRGIGLGQIIRKESRQYEFNLQRVAYLDLKSRSTLARRRKRARIKPNPDFRKLFLYIKGEGNHFDKVGGISYLHGGITQKIPFDYSTLSKLKSWELELIWQDFD